MYENKSVPPSLLFHLLYFNMVTSDMSQETRITWRSMGKVLWTVFILYVKIHLSAFICIFTCISLQSIQVTFSERANLLVDHKLVKCLGRTNCRNLTVRRREDPLWNWTGHWPSRIARYKLEAWISIPSPKSCSFSSIKLAQIHRNSPNQRS